MTRPSIGQDAVFVLSGQIASLAILILALKYFTSVMSPDAYGAAALALGLAGIVVASSALPVMQILHNRYFAADGTRDERLVVAVSRRLRESLLVYGAAITVLAVVISPWGGAGLFCYAIAIAFIAVADGIRAFILATLALEHNQAAVALLSVADSALRALGGALVLHVTDRSPSGLLWGFVLGAILAVVLGAVVSKSIRGVIVLISSPTNHQLPKDAETFMRPLRPSALVGWVTSTGDRFVASAVTDLATTGVYVATQSLGSRPPLTLSSFAVSLFRPRYSRLCAIRAPAKALRRLRIAWLASVLIPSALLLVVIAAFAPLLTQLLLGPEFQEGSAVLLPLAVGYVGIALAQSVNSIQLAHGESRIVLFSEVSSAVVLLVLGASLGVLWGLVGLSIAVAVAGGVQASIALVHYWMGREGNDYE